MLESHFVNIFDFIDCKRAGKKIDPVFNTISSFRRYIKKGEYAFPKAAAKQNPLLSILLEKLFSGGMGHR